MFELYLLSRDYEETYKAYITFKQDKVDIGIYEQRVVHKSPQEVIEHNESIQRLERKLCPICFYSTSWDFGGYKYTIKDGKTYRREIG